MPPDGSIRRSQIITTYGPGALVDLLGQAVIVGGLDFWNYGNGSYRNIHEPRLRDSLDRLFRAKGRSISVNGAFREPPLGDDQEPTSSMGIQALEFPAWMVCKNPGCRALIKKSGLERKKDCYMHDCTGAVASPCVPVRFVTACKHGHISDFPWVWFAHMNRGEICAAPNLKLLEGATGDFSEIHVTCACGESRSLKLALDEHWNPECRGERPWLGANSDEKCEERMRLLVRAASNSYFAQVVSALSIPDTSSKVHDAVQTNWDLLQNATREILTALRAVPKIEEICKEYGEDNVLAAVKARKNGEQPKREALRTAEFKTFIAASREVPGELPGLEEQFFARELVTDALPTGAHQIVLAARLREVRAQIGFTRLEGMTPNLQGEYTEDFRSAEIGLTADWLPAAEIMGEGVFIRFDEDTVRAWEARPAVKRREEQLAAGHADWARTRGLESPPPFPGARFYMLHSLSHLLITAISLECGYSASALRERIYCAPAGDDTPMAAILLLTGTSGSEGTLGGLVEQGRNLSRHLANAYDIGILCSSDPVCAAHSPAGDFEERFLDGAACHGCLFIAESSCERFNSYLDRALVVPCIGQDPNSAFLDKRPRST